MIYLCPHCQTQNFFPPARKKLQSKVPLRCWKCGRHIKGAKKNENKSKKKSFQKAK